MTTTQVKVWREECDGAVTWVFEWFDGAEEFAEAWGRLGVWMWSADEVGAVVEVAGEHAGLVAQDWLRDRGIEPVVG